MRKHYQVIALPKNNSLDLRSLHHQNYHRRYEEQFWYKEGILILAKLDWTCKKTSSTKVFVCKKFFSVWSMEAVLLKLLCSPVFICSLSSLPTVQKLHNFEKV